MSVTIISSTLLHFKSISSQGGIVASLPGTLDVSNQTKTKRSWPLFPF